MLCLYEMFVEPVFMFTKLPMSMSTSSRVIHIDATKISVFHEHVNIPLDSRNSGPKISEFFDDSSLLSTRANKEEKSERGRE